MGVPRVDSMDLDHNITQNIYNVGSSLFFFFCSVQLGFKLIEHGHFLMNSKLWLLAVELRKRISLDFLQGYENCQI